MTDNGGGRYGSSEEEQERQKPGSWFTPTGDRYRTQSHYQDPYTGDDEVDGAAGDAAPARDADSTPGSFGGFPNTGGYPGMSGTRPGMAEPYPSALGGLGSDTREPTGAQPSQSGLGSAPGQDLPGGLPPLPGAPGYPGATGGQPPVGGPSPADGPSSTGGAPATGEQSSLGGRPPAGGPTHSGGWPGMPASEPDAPMPTSPQYDLGTGSAPAYDPRTAPGLPPYASGAPAPYAGPGDPMTGSTPSEPSAGDARDRPMAGADDRPAPSAPSDGESTDEAPAGGVYRVPTGAQPAWTPQGDLRDLPFNVPGGTGGYPGFGSSVRRERPDAPMAPTTEEAHPAAPDQQDHRGTDHAALGQELGHPQEAAGPVPGVPAPEPGRPDDPSARLFGGPALGADTNVRNEPERTDHANGWAPETPADTTDFSSSPAPSAFPPYSDQPERWDRADASGPQPRHGDGGVPGGATPDLAPKGPQDGFAPPRDEPGRPAYGEPFGAPPATTGGFPAVSTDPAARSGAGYPAGGADEGRRDVRWDDPLSAGGTWTPSDDAVQEAGWERSAGPVEPSLPTGEYTDELSRPYMGRQPAEEPPAGATTGQWESPWAATDVPPPTTGPFARIDPAAPSPAEGDTARSGEGVPRDPEAPGAGTPAPGGASSDLGGQLGTGSGNTWAFSRDDPRLPDSVREEALRAEQKRRDGSPEHTTQFFAADPAGPSAADSEPGADSAPAADDPLASIAAQQAQARAQGGGAPDSDEGARLDDWGARLSPMPSPQRGVEDELGPDRRGEAEYDQRGDAFGRGPGVDEAYAPEPWAPRPDVIGGGASGEPERGADTQSWAENTSYADAMQGTQAMPALPDDLGADRRGDAYADPPAGDRPAEYGYDGGPDGHYAYGDRHVEDGPGGWSDHDGYDHRPGPDQGYADDHGPDAYGDYGPDRDGRFAPDGGDPYAPAPEHGDRYADHADYDAGYRDRDGAEYYDDEGYDGYGEPAPEEPSSRRGRGGRDPIADDFPGFNDGPLDGGSGDPYPGYDNIDYWPETESGATTTLWLGILGLVPVIGLFTALAAFITGPKAKRNIQASDGELEGLNLVTTGTVLAAVGIVLFLVEAAVAVVMFI
ncbi:hypothetical protein CDO52_25250 [Nocardiopsis gilva YIM 90087]|uniref:DUF4190 domain-containing protein n=2 Tax=Nocardiopsis gilva TaxID=280236 RepID=A0A223SC42_9ACTN|nr:hypothetical protein [Nocardiopsis gilva]ASU85670.1 hypothetical protein CDO52_25250 [Nocardiopsis gilva YIM 90087]